MFPFKQARPDGPEAGQMQIGSSGLERIFTAAWLRHTDCSPNRMGASS
jgi:hypothetical protein